MKVLSWNIGNFIWAPLLPGRTHYAFHRKDAEAVISLVKKEDADIVFLQEIVEKEDISFLLQSFPLFRFHDIIKTEKHAYSLFLSKYPIQEIKHTYSNDYIISGITFFPIHLYAFSPERRKKETRRLLPDLPEKKGIVLGDTNFWIYKKRFLSKRDKESYELITEKHSDALAHLGETCRIHLSLDKFFVTKDIEITESKIIKHSIGHMDHYAIAVTLANVS